MKTWTLVWFLVFPPTGEDKLVTFKSGSEANMTYTDCVAEVAEKEAEWNQSQYDGNILGYEVYCKDQRGTPVPVEQKQ